MGLGIQHSIKWNNSTFLTCGNRDVVSSFSVIEPYFEMKKEFDCLSRNSAIYRMMKIDSDLFLLVNEEGELIVASYTQGSVVRKLGVENINSLTRFVLSKKYLGCFYINTIFRGHDNKIKLINYLEQHHNNCDTNTTNKRVVKVFNTGENYKGYIYSIEVYLDRHSNKEILICGGSNSKLYFYDTEENVIFKTFHLYGFIYFIRCVQNKYLCVGDRLGTFFIFDLENMNENKSKKKKYSMILKRRIHKNRLYHIEVLDLGMNFMRVSTSSFDGKLTIQLIGNLDFSEFLTEKQVKQDLQERIKFIRGSSLYQHETESSSCKITVSSSVEMEEGDGSHFSIILTFSDVNFFVLKTFKSLLY